MAIAANAWQAIAFMAVSQGDVLNATAASQKSEGMARELGDKRLLAIRCLHLEQDPKGFEIVGISFDQEREALEKFVAKEKMAWPHYFDGKGWGNKFGREFGINGIPAMCSSTSRASSGI